MSDGPNSPENPKNIPQIELEEGLKEKMTPKIQKAIDTATTLHRDQTRKTDGTPYIIHPITVASILARYTQDEDVIAAGLLHDVLEDVPNYSAGELTDDFGERVCNIVKEVSEDKSPSDTPEQNKASWEKRKSKYLDNLRNDSHEALLVCCADKISNITSLMQAYDKQGDEIWQKFNAPKDKQMWFYNEVLQILKEKLHSPIVDEFENLYKEAKVKFKGAET